MKVSCYFMNRNLEAFQLLFMQSSLFANKPRISPFPIPLRHRLPEFIFSPTFIPFQRGTLTEIKAVYHPCERPNKKRHPVYYLVFGTPPAPAREIQPPTQPTTLTCQYSQQGEREINSYKIRHQNLFFTHIVPLEQQGSIYHQNETEIFRFKV